ncbi:MFS transporter [Snodgrassella sp. CFCC 13594]|uniref:MFS transporter n=1 Tax=Snodgrassella sp. CFCC 13594 TaxID=1775559 RepID=UPI000B06F227|nr:MFS transporter [Snodgrassella sp. CFCC 13594]
MTHKSLLALSLGTFALGMAEFGMMGILPYVATGLSITLAQAGHLISAYALGVCFGACFLIFAHRIPLKHILLGLAIMMALGNTLAALAPNQSFLLVARFLSGLPHGAYFGVGSIVATQLAPAGKSTQAVAVMVAGMTVANLLGVPLGTFVSQYISWRLVFALVAAVAVALWWALRRWIPDLASLPSSGLRDQFRFLGTPAPWLLLGATLLGNGGIFCWYSYVHPMLTQIAGFSENQAGGLMMLAGAAW